MKRLGILFATAVAVFFVGCRSEEPRVIYQQQPPVYCCPTTCTPVCTPAPACAPAYSTPAPVAQPRR